MTQGMATGGRSKNLVLAAMIFAVAMTFIDQTIVSIAVPEIQRELGLTSTGVQWAVNAYLLSLAALFAFGGRLADTVGHRKDGGLGVIVFAGASTMCGLTPKGSVAEAWIVTFRVIQGAGGAASCSRPPWPSWCRPSRSVSGAGRSAVLRHRRGPDLDRSHPRRVPHGVDLAGHLLGQPPRCRRRARVDRHIQARHGAPAGAHGLPRSGSDRPGRGHERVRLSAVGDLGLEQPGTALAIAGGRGPPGRVLSRRAAHFLAADPDEHLPDPPLPGRELRPRHRHAGVRPRLLLRQRIRPGRAGQDGVDRPASTSCTSSSASWSRPRSADASSTDGGPSARW